MSGLEIMKMIYWVHQIALIAKNCIVDSCCSSKYDESINELKILVNDIYKQIEILKEWEQEKINAKVHQLLVILQDVLTIKGKLRENSIVELYRLSSELYVLDVRKIGFNDFEQAFIFCIGAYGRYLSFNFTGEKEKAYLESISCIKKYPIIGLNLFPGYCTEEQLDELNEVEKELLKGWNNNFDSCHPNLEIYKGYDYQTRLEFLKIHKDMILYDVIDNLNT